MTVKQAAITLLAVALATAITRFAPFVLFRKIPGGAFSEVAGKLPAAMTGLLVVYCLKGVDAKSYPYGLPEAAALIVIALTYVWKRNLLVSIFSGVLVYVCALAFLF